MPITEDGSANDSEGYKGKIFKYNTVNPEQDRKHKISMFNKADLS